MRLKLFCFKNRDNRGRFGTCRRGTQRSRAVGRYQCGNTQQGKPHTSLRRSDRASIWAGRPLSCFRSRSPHHHYYYYYYYY